MKYKLYLREIHVTPVIVEAESLEKAQEACREGDGEYLNNERYFSDLSAAEYFDSLFEKDAEIIDSEAN